MKRRIRIILTRTLAASAILLASGAGRAAACPPDALGVSRVVEIGTSGGLQIGLKTYPRSLALADHEIVLTFDDGPAAGTTPKVLDALAKECVKATFFLVGRNAEALSDLVKREVTDGHTVAHHTFSHPDVTMRGLSDSAARIDILHGFAADDKAAYGTSGSAPRVPFFRFPGFADTQELVDWLSSQNIAVFGADLWASDWTLMTADAERNLVLERLDKEGHGIVLFHDTKQQTAAMLPAFLQELKKRGFKIVHIIPGSATPPLQAAPPGWTSATEKIIAEVFARQHRAASEPWRIIGANPAARKHAAKTLKNGAAKMQLAVPKGPLLIYQKVRLGASGRVTPNVTPNAKPSFKVRAHRSIISEHTDPEANFPAARNRAKSCRDERSEEFRNALTNLGRSASIFWSQWLHTAASIRRAAMDGTL